MVTNDTLSNTATQMKGVSEMALKYAIIVSSTGRLRNMEYDICMDVIEIRETGIHLFASGCPGASGSRLSFTGDKIAQSIGTLISGAEEKGIKIECIVSKDFGETINGALLECARELTICFVPGDVGVNELANKAQEILFAEDDILEQQSIQPLPRSKKDIEREILELEREMLELRVMKMQFEVADMAAARSSASVSNEDDEALKTHDYALGKLFREIMFYDKAFPDYPGTNTIGCRVEGHPMTKGKPIFVSRDMSTKTVTFSL